MNPKTAYGQAFQGILFMAISGVVTLVVGLAAVNQRHFVASAKPAQGTVVTLLTERHDSKTRYRPEVQFTAPDGQPVKFRSSMSSSPAAYRVGEAVDVLFDPANPRKAEIDDFKTLWLGPVIGGSMGLLFLILGAFIAAKGLRAVKKILWLKKSGRLIETEFQKVETVGGPAVIPVEAGQPPTPAYQQVLGAGAKMFTTSTSRRRPRYYQILSLGTEDGGAKREFLSEPLLKDPSAKLMTGQKIGVYVDPQDYGEYYMDLAFLKK
jgi:hypothetical protein